MIEYILFIVILSIKCLLFNTNQSTDFEVHRNWKALTTSLPIKEWYINNLNIWTLDYPPLFAYMEFILGMISKLFDENITDLKKINYSSDTCKFYMRCTVLIGDFLMFYSLKKLSNNLNLSTKNLTILIGSIQGFAGLIIVDNIHFQYNAILFSLFFLSINYIISDNFILGAFYYIIALCMKHIFIYMAPAYLIYYLKFLVLSNLKNKPMKVFKDILLIVITMVSIILLTFSPFLYVCYKEKSINQLIHIKDRLFPFQRGLLHSYWAPNFWALYSFADKILFFLKNKNSEYKKRNISALGATSPNGVTQETGFDILPDITSNFSNLIVISLIFVYISKTIFFEKNNIDKKENKLKLFLKYCIMSNLIFFNFGYQVHEKAFIIISLMTLIYVIVNDLSKKMDCISILSFLLVLIGVLAQIPLIHDYRDYFTKIIIVFCYICFVKIMIFNENSIHKSIIYNLVLFGYIFVSIILDFNTIFKEQFNYNLNKYLLQLGNINKKFPFISLMLYSVISSIMTQICFIIMLIFC